ncbi:MAG: hypothetical protein LCH41_13310 [Armatimonadetes bacterium]|nr:hypothetical protein [Armatimonadota bacterium]
MMQRRRSQKGHTLLEAMMSAFLALICALIFTATIPVANLTRGKAENTNSAVSLAQKTIETLRGQGYPNTTPTQLLSNGLIQSTTPVNLHSIGAGTAGETGFEFTETDTGVVDSPRTVLPNGRGFIRTESLQMGLRRVTVIVIWQERSETKLVRLSTLVANL